MKFMHIGDVHLGAQPDQGRPWSGTRRQDIYDSLEETLYRAKREQVDVIFIAGDLFHRQPLKKELKELNALFQSLGKVKVIFIAGNHDYVTPTSYYRSFSFGENVIFLGKEEMSRVYLEEWDTYVYGMSYWHRELPVDVYDSVKVEHPDSVNILLAHGGDERHLPFSPKKLVENGFDYVACGHIHKPEQLIEGKVVMAGSLEPLDCNETGPHGYFMGTIVDKKVDISFYPIKKCEYVHIPVVVSKDTTNLVLKQKLTQYIEKQPEYRIFKFILQGHRSQDVEFDREQIERLERVVGVEDETVPDYDFQKLKTQGNHPLLSAFIEAMEEKGNTKVARKALYYGVDAIIQEMR